MPGPDSVKVSVYSNGAGSATPSNLFEIDEVPMDSYLASISDDFTKDGIHFLRLPYSRAPVYDSSDNLDKAASIYGIYVSSVMDIRKLAIHIVTCQLGGVSSKPM